MFNIKVATNDGGVKKFYQFSCSLTKAVNANLFVLYKNLIAIGFKSTILL